MIEEEHSFMTFDIENQTLNKWQKTIDLLSSILDIPAALIMRLNKNKIEVFVSSESENNPYKKGDNEVFLNSGLYCEHVIKTQKTLFVKNALKSNRWKNNPDTKLNMINYLGVPINSPDETPFGTICVLNNEEKVYTDDHINLLNEFKSIIEADLKSISLYKRLVASERVASLRELLSGMAHEINTPVGVGVTAITHLKSLTRNLKQDYESGSMDKDDFEDYLLSTFEITDLVHSNLNKTAQTLKRFKHLTASKTDEKATTFNLKEHIINILSSMKEMMSKSHLKVMVISDENIIINSYPEAISEVITNLVINSITHGYSNRMTGKINIECKKNRGGITIIYQDDGSGISRDNIERVFDPLFTTDRKKGSKGLGLCIIYNIVTLQLKGSVQCSSNRKKGVEFIIKFNSLLVAS